MPHSHLPTITTKRLILRPVERADLPRLVELYDDEGVAAGVLSLPHPYTLEDAERWFGGVQDRIRSGIAVLLGVALRETGALIGTVGLRIEREHDRAELGYMLGRAYWGAGHAPEAGRALAEYGFERLALNTIMAGTWEWNEASGIVLRKIGMRFEGRFREQFKKGDAHHDSMRYSILRSEYDASRAAGTPPVCETVIDPELTPGARPVAHTTAQIAELLPEINQIKDPSLRDKVAAVWSEALTTGAGGKGWTFDELRAIPFTLLAGDIDLRYIEHLRSCARQCLAIADVLNQIFGDRIPVNRDHLLAGSLLADVGKPLEFDRDKGGKLIKGRFGDMLRHPFSGVAMCYKHGIPPEVMHIVATHSHEGDKVERSIESIIFHHADFIDFDIAKFLGKKR